MSTPVEELRAAATKVRKTAAGATPGPWEAGGIGNYGWTVAPAERAMSDWQSLCIETDDSERGRADAAWIALASPALAEPIADWLEACAKDLETAARVVAKWGDAEQLKYADYIDEPDSAQHALAVARQINGSAS